MSEAESEKKQGFKINDQRRFNPDGSLRDGELAPEVSQEPAETAAPPPQKEEAETFSADAESTSKGPYGSLPADLSTLILSLATSAQMAMGLAPHPESGKAHRNLEQARHAIDMLAVLQEKTRGNLSAEEQQLLQAVLTELRMGFVEVQRSDA